MGKEKEFSVWEDNPFIEGLFEFMASPEGELADEVREFTWQLLEKVDVDARDRRLIWDDGRRLTIDESVRRLHEHCRDYPVDLIEDYLIVWIEGEFIPENYSQEQMDELDRLTGEWIEDYEGLRKS